MTEPNNETGPTQRRAPNPENRPVNAGATASQVVETVKISKDKLSVNDASEQGNLADREAIERFLIETVGDAIHLAYIPDGCAPVCRYFGRDAAAAARWAAEQNDSGLNVYWSMNRVPAGFHSKPSERDMVAARWVHCEIDPPKDGSPFDRSALIEAASDSRTPPSVVLNSGNGLWFLWRLDGDCSNLASIKEINLGAKAMFGADACGNVDRLARLPYTWNYPNASKLARGYRTVFATVEVDDTGQAFDPEELRAVFPVPEGAAPAERIDVELGRYTLLTCDDLGLTPLHSLRRAIETPRGTDRSAYGQAAAHEGVRYGLTDDEIAGLLLNRDNPAAEHFLAQADTMRAVKRAISRARGADPDINPVPPETRAAVAQLGLEDADRAAKSLPPSTLPAATFNLDTEPGLLGDIARWAVASAYRPVEGFAVPAALATLAAIFGRRIATPTGLGVNMFLAAVAGTGIGKDALIEAPRKLLAAADLRSRIGPGDFASDTAIEKCLRARPCHLMPLDEFGKLMQVLMGSRRPAHSEAAVKVLLSLYSRSQPGSEWTGKARAMDTFDVAAEPIHCPTLTILGTSTPEGFFKGMNPDTLEDGFINRLTLFEVGKAGPRNRDQNRMQPPSALVDALRSAYSSTAPAGDLAALASDAPGIAPTFIYAQWADDAAMAALEAIEQWQDIAVEEEKRNWSAGRAAEQSLKIATLRAASRNPAQPSITAEDMGWAFSIVHASVEALERGAREMMAGSAFESAVNVVRAAIAKHGAKGVYWAKLLKAKGVTALDNRTVEQAIERLVQTGDILSPTGRHYTIA